MFLVGVDIKCGVIFVLRIMRALELEGQFNLKIESQLKVLILAAICGPFVIHLSTCLVRNEEKIDATPMLL
jgi:hypothetical protein